MSRISRKKRIPISYFHCTGCQNVIPLPRVHRQREKGHIKDIYCPYCEKVQKMIEERIVDWDFTAEICKKKENTV